MRPIITLACILATLFVGSTRAQGVEEQPVHVDEIWRSVVEKPDPESAQRAQVLRVLEHPATEEVARNYQLDLDGAKRAVSVLHGSDLQQLAARAAIAESKLVGGDSISINTTTLIIILLVVIILILVV